MISRLTVLVLIATVATGQVVANDTFLELELVPRGEYPVGPTSANYTLATGATASAGVGLVEPGWLMPRFELAYGYVPLAADANLSIVRAGMGAQLRYDLGARFRLLASGSVGGYYGLLRGPTEATGYGFAYRAAAGVAYDLGSRFSIVGGVAFDSIPGLYSAAGAFAGVAYRWPLARGGDARGGSTAGDAPPPEDGWTTLGDLRVGHVQLERMFPVLFKYYDDHPIGSIVIENPGRRAVRNVEVRFDAERIIDNPKLSASLPEVAPGERVEVDLFALFNDQVLTITEGTRLAAAIGVRYETDDGTREESFTVTLGTYDRNALRWDDDTKIAAFVTAKDDEIQRLGKNMAALSRTVGLDAVSRELQLAMAQFALMQVSGLAYVVDPTSAYAELSADSSAVDYVQFPRQTLEYRAGDCDDLSATYNALLESVGVATAFVTIPGHIYAAFELEMGAAEARAAFTNRDDLIVRDDGAWIPVETTVLERGFMEAWSVGARQ